MSLEEKKLENVENASVEGVTLQESSFDELTPDGYIKKARELYDDNKPRRWDEAYAYYTSDDAAPIMDSGDRMNVVNILNHGKYNRKIIRFSIMAFVISIIGIFMLDRVTLFDIRAFIKIILILLEAFVIVSGIYLHKKNRFSSVHWMLPGISVIWCLYLLFWVV